MVSFRCLNKKPPPEVLEHLKAAKIKYINFSIADYFGNVKGVEMNYIDFLKSKQISCDSSGFDCSEFNSMLFDWQKDVTRWGLKKGKVAYFEECGLGKTIQQLEFAEQVHIHTDLPVLILAPLAVARQTADCEGRKFGYSVNICRTQADVINGVNITNYEMIEHFDADKFSGIVLDESSILKSYNSKTKQYLTDAFRYTPYKLCCTATPSPNDFTELGNHAEFLGIMTRSEMLATFFVHDGGSTQDWRLKGHAKDKFFEWVASWACCLTTPADLGYDADAYKLPDLRIIEHSVLSDNMIDADGQIRLFASNSLSLSERRQARKESMQARTYLVADIVNSTDEQCIVWCDYNDESALSSKLINGAVEVKGSDSDFHKTSSMLAFSNGDIKCIVSKPKIAGWGMNWQNCHNVIFNGLSDSFEAYYQAIRRCWRFGQKQPVNVHIIISDAEGAVKDNIEKKQADAVLMTKELVKYTKDILNSEIRQTNRVTDRYSADKKVSMPRWIGGKQ